MIAADVGEEEEEIAGAVVAEIGISIEVVVEGSIEEVQDIRGRHAERETIESMSYHLGVTPTFLQLVIDETKGEDHLYHALGRLQDQSRHHDLHQDDAVGQLQNLGHHHPVGAGPDHQRGAIAGGVVGDAPEAQREDHAVDPLRLQNPALHLESEEELQQNL